MKNKLHWYLISFMYPNPTGGIGVANTNAGFTDKHVTGRRIKNAKKEMDIPEDANTLAVSYLGYMTEADVSA